MNYIFINRKKTKLNLDKFDRNIVQPISFIACTALMAVVVYMGTLLAFGIREAM